MTIKSSNTKNLILVRVAAGDQSAFNTLFETYHQRIYSFAFFLTHSELLAEEVTQEIFIKIWNHRSELLELNFFDAWLKTVIRNHCYTFLNRLAKEKIILDEINKQETTELNTTEDKIFFYDYSTLLKRALNRLPKQQRKVFILSRQEGVKNEDIAKMMNLSINTVKCHKKAALRNIRIFLGNNPLFFFFVLEIMKKLNEAN